MGIINYCSNATADIYAPPGPPSLNWTMDFTTDFALMALDYAAASYSDDPIPCLRKHGAALVMIDHIPCDVVGDQPGNVLKVEYLRKHVSCITWVLVETMSSPKHNFPSGGSVQRYFFAALKKIWNKGFGQKLRQLRIENPQSRFLFTGHSLGGALVSLASSLFAFENLDLIGPNDIHLVTFGQPRVGNMDYASGHDLLVPNSWRLIHRYDIVAHLPYCYESLTRKCTPLYNHGPWHHGTEIWYEDGMSPNSSLFKICRGAPINEDDECSNGYYVHYTTADHFLYFERDVDSYGSAGCVEPQFSKRNRSMVYRRRNNTKFRLQNL
ncbi:lipase (class 3) domain-containing protein [Ditylenchus destructor]|uniref:Lipase (Class 3) domain-containing protein n=1 Tax=Ditylenchus destructor TaxID=166010 RepID=A0AAD4R064_9BILA|nr:lipase (class 3) domain-containing protein [Ditylenchus destructor]